ncbi:hypothetical protein ACQ86G_17110 [Roseateles chitinivorans]|uniref:hypothetical protein n=1 Tax=Roseateles chitinivorans TaxID=2917965 RepID=UPI003D66BBCD
MSKFIGGLNDNAQILAAGTLVSVVTVTGVSSIGPPAPPTTGAGTPPPVSPTGAGDPPAQVDQANVALAEFVNQIRNASTSAGNFSLQVGTAASEASGAARAASEVLQGVVLLKTKDGTVTVKLEGPQLGHLTQAIADSKLTAERAASAAESAATSASHSSTAAQKAADTAAALDGANGQVARVNQTLRQTSRGGVRSGEGNAR